jgi:anthraniloyl-CoA monooxygenase
MLEILQRRAHALGVELRYETEVTDLDRFAGADLIVAADGVNSASRQRYAAAFQPQIEMGRNRFVWLGTSKPFPAFTFIFKHDRHGLWRVHAYQYEKGGSTFIVETTEETWRKAGLDRATEDDTLAYCEALFADDLGGHRLLKNRSLWRSFPTVRNARWSHRNIVLLGDAVHTAHFSIGSGTKLAMEDAIALSRTLSSIADVPAALAAYERERRPAVDAVQRAARVSLDWFENTERYAGKLEPLQFAFAMLTRSLRITHANLKLRDPKLVERVDSWFAARAAVDTRAAPPPPMFTPFRLRDLVLANRVVVSPMCQYSAEDGMPNDWHLVHLGSRAIGGAGLVIAEMTDVSRDGRITPGCTGLYRDEHVAAWRRIVEFVHANSAAKIGVQLAHAGRKGSTRLAWEGIDEPLPSGNWPLIAASAIPYLPQSQVPIWTRCATTSCARRAARTPRGSIWSRFTWRMAICWHRSSRRSPIVATTAMAVLSTRACDSHSKSCVRCARRGPCKSRSPCVFLRPIGPMAARPPRTPSRLPARCAKPAPTSSMSRPDRPSPMTRRSMAGCSRRRSPTASGSRRALQR